MRVRLLIAGLLAAGSASAGALTLTPEPITEWKPIYGTVEPRNEVPARARIGGLIAELLVTEGDDVTAGQRIATVHDEKIGFQITAYDAQIEALRAQLATAEAELGRGETLVERGVTTRQQVDQLRTTVDVTRGQLASVEAGRAVVVQQAAEGDVLAPEDGRVLKVPVTRGAVVLAGEPVATIGSGGLFLRLSVPERHASALKEGDTIRIGAGGAATEGRLAKVYPEIEGGRVTVDVEVPELPGAFINARVPVELPVGERQVLLVPAAAVATRSGIDFVTVIESGAEVARAVVLGEPVGDRVEVLTGLRAGDEILVP
jgi:RND family efflux transporter MFP subunit